MLGGGPMRTSTPAFWLLLLKTVCLVSPATAHSELSVSAANDLEHRRAAVSQSPTDEDAHIALAYRETVRYTHAVPTSGVGPRLSATLLEAWVSDTAGAAGVAEALLREPQNPVSLIHAAVFKMRKGDLMSAVPLLTEAIEFGPRSVRVSDRVFSECRYRNAEAYRNLGTCLHMLSLNKKAHNVLKQAIALDPADAHSYNNLGAVLIGGMKPRAAAEAFFSVAQLQPSGVSGFYNLDHAYRQYCFWHKRRYFTAKLLGWAQQQMAAGQDLTLGAYPALTYRLRPELLMQITRYRAAASRRLADWRCELKPPPQAVRLRVALVSSDLGDHPGIVCMYNRGSFEWILYATSSKAGGINAKVRAAIQECAGPGLFHDVSGMNPMETAQYLCQHRPHIALDLNGYSTGAKAAVFAAQPSPVQMTAIGYPDTLGASWIPYILTDRHTFYSERAVQLPFSFHSSAYEVQVTSSGAQALCTEPDNIVLAVYNQPYKVAPAIFGVWTSALHRSMGRALLQVVQWPLEVGDQLMIEAKSRGAGWATRLAPRLDRDQHLARAGCADLLLDTPVLNGGTTVMDALSQSLPVICLREGRMASRVAAGLVEAVFGSAADQLWRTTLKGYEDQVVAFVLD